MVPLAVLPIGAVTPVVAPLMEAVVARLLVWWLLALVLLDLLAVAVAEAQLAVHDRPVVVAVLAPLLAPIVAALPPVAVTFAPQPESVYSLL